MKHQISYELPYHVTNRTCNRTKFPLPMKDLWELCSDYLYLCNRFYNFQIHNFVLMNNHYHALITTPDGNLSAGMMYFNREVSKKINRYSGRLNQNFGSRYFRCTIPTYHYYMHCYKYVYRNPVEAGICKFVETYPYSTLSGLLGNQHLLIPTVEDSLIFSGSFEENLNWLNRAPKKEHHKIVRQALFGSEFSLATRRSSRTEHSLQTNLY